MSLADEASSVCSPVASDFSLLWLSEGRETIGQERELLLLLAWEAKSGLQDDRDLVLLDDVPVGRSAR